MEENYNLYDFKIGDAIVEFGSEETEGYGDMIRTIYVVTGYRMAEGGGSLCTKGSYTDRDINLADIGYGKRFLPAKQALERVYHADVPMVMAFGKPGVAQPFKVQAFDQNQDKEDF